MARLDVLDKTARRELGKVVRTTFILQYMDEEDTRHRVNHAQTKSENLHQLAAELNLGKNGLIRYARQEDLLVMARSKQLLINAMTCWNMLRITQQLLESSPEERAVLLAAIPHTAPLSWKHSNFQPGGRCRGIRFFGGCVAASAQHRLNQYVEKQRWQKRDN